MRSNVQQIRALLEIHCHEIPVLFFKTTVGEYAEHDQFLGISVANLRKIAKQFYFLEGEEHTELLRSKYNEERLLALIILVQQYQQADWMQQEKIVQYYLEHLSCINNWNLVDASAHYILGAYCYFRDTSILIKLANSTKLWEKRIAIVATWYFIKKKQVELTYLIAEKYLDSKEDLIHKATGWMLREAGKINLERLKRFLKKYAQYMPRTMLRYAIEKMDEQDRSMFLTIKTSKKYKKFSN